MMMHFLMWFWYSKEDRSELEYKIVAIVAKFMLPVESISNYYFSKRNLENILTEILTLKEN
jgi:uncharacterized protein YqgC (DUF456 family)